MVLGRKQKQSDIPARRRRSTESKNDTHDAGQRQRAAQFRRGSTLAGSTQSRIRAVDSRALKNATPREKLHHLSNVRRKIVGVLSTILIVSIVLAVVIWQFSANVHVTSGPAVALANPIVESYEKAIQSYLSANPVQRLRFNLNHEQLNDYMIRRYPEIDNIKQEGFKALTTTSFSVTMRQPIVSWKVDATNYFVDAQGVSFTESVYPSPNVTIVDNSGVRHTAGTAIASERFLSFVGRAVALAQQNELEVRNVNIPAGTSRQVSFEVRGVNYPIILSIDRSAAEQIEDALRAINYFKRQQKNPDYIDVRVKGKAFYRE